MRARTRSGGLPVMRARTRSGGPQVMWAGQAWIDRLEKRRLAFSDSGLRETGRPVLTLVRVPYNATAGREMRGGRRYGRTGK